MDFGYLASQSGDQRAVTLLRLVVRLQMISVRGDILHAEAVQAKLEVARGELWSIAGQQNIGYALRVC